MPSAAPNEYTSSLRDSVLDNSSIIEDMSPEASEFFMDWAVTLSERVGPTIADDAQYDDKKRSLSRLLRMLNAYISRRHETDEASLHTLLERINKFITDLDLQIIEEDVEAALRQHASDEDLSFVQRLTSSVLPMPLTENDTGPSVVRARVDATKMPIDEAHMAEAQALIDQLEHMARRIIDTDDGLPQEDATPTDPSNLPRIGDPNKDSE